MITKYVVSVDWLQVFCHWESPISVDVKGSFKCSELSLVRRPYGSSMWASIGDVYYKDVVVAEICWCPRSSVQHRKSCTVKLANRVLYCNDMLPMLAEVLSTWNLTYKGITRLDLCYDCNILRDGLQVQKLISDYLNSPAGAAGHVVRKGSNRFQVFGRRTPAGATEYTAIRWGSVNSNIGSYCYNKSLELLEVKDKPWIREVWERNGLVHETRFDEWAAKKEYERLRDINSGHSLDFVHTPVWRFEISIKAEGKDILNIGTGELSTIELDWLCTYNNIRKLFFVYADKVFHFDMSTGQKLRRHYPPLYIFEDQQYIPARPVALNRNVGTGRTERICYNKLQELCHKYTDMPEVTRQGLNEAMEFLLRVAMIKDSTIRELKLSNYLAEFNGRMFVDSLTRLHHDAIDSVAEEKVACAHLSDPHYWESLIWDATHEFVEPYAEYSPYCLHIPEV